MASAWDHAMHDLLARHDAVGRAEVESVLSAASDTVRRSVGRVDLVLAADLADLRLAIRSQHLGR